MEDFIVNEKEIELPSSWEDVSWEKFLGFSKLIEKLTTREELDSKDEAAQWQRTLDELKDNTKILSFWCNLPEEEIGMLDMEKANEIMQVLSFINESYKPIHLDSFTLGDEKFILPEEFMENSSFGRYIEAEQLELHANMMEKGRLDVLPKQIAILCKKEGEEEKLNDDLIDERAKKFEKLDMATIWDIGFFLGKLEQKLMLSFLTSTEREETQQQI